MAHLQRRSQRRRSHHCRPDGEASDVMSNLISWQQLQLAEQQLVRRSASTLTMMSRSQNLMAVWACQKAQYVQQIIVQFDGSGVRRRAFRMTCRCMSCLNE